VIRVEKIEFSCWPSLSNKAFVPFRLYEKMIAHRALAAATSRAYAKRSMSDAPKMHKAKDVWRQIEATRPKDDHPHVSMNRSHSAKSAINILIVYNIPTFFFKIFYHRVSQLTNKNFNQ